MMGKMNIQHERMQQVFKALLLDRGLDEEAAEEVASTFVENTLDGIPSHGINRFMSFLKYIDKGYIKVDGRAYKHEGIGALERWDGQQGIGILNAGLCMDRAIELAKTYGIGLVALKNTNHWMRGGTYGRQAADEGYIGICWTNTKPNMPAWGAKDCHLGNNPLVLAVPRDDGHHVILDCAMAQFSYGQLANYRLRGEALPVVGGYDLKGEETKDPKEIERSGRPLSIGYWKGSGLSLMLDLIATVLSGGNAVCDLGKQKGEEYNISQVFIAISPNLMNTQEETEEIVNRILADLKISIPDQEVIRYPGEYILDKREQNKKEGLLVDSQIWEEILEEHRYCQKRQMRRAKLTTGNYDK